MEYMTCKTYQQRGVGSKLKVWGGGHKLHHEALDKNLLGPTFHLGPHIELLCYKANVHRVRNPSAENQSVSKRQYIFSTHESQVIWRNLPHWTENIYRHQTRPTGTMQQNAATFRCQKVRGQMQYVPPNFKVGAWASPQPSLPTPLQ